MSDVYVCMSLPSKLMEETCIQTYKKTAQMSLMKLKLLQSTCNCNMHNIIEACVYTYMYYPACMSARGSYMRQRIFHRTTFKLGAL